MDFAGILKGLGIKGILRVGDVLNCNIGVLNRYLYNQEIH